MFNLQKAKLISLVRDRPIIWDKNHELHKNRSETRKAWFDVFKQLIPGYEEMDQEKMTIYGANVMKKWTNMKDCYRRSERNYRKALKSGEGKHSTTRYVYSRKLHFLKKTMMGECSTGGDNDSDNEESSYRYEDEDEDGETDMFQSLEEVVIPCDMSATCETPGGKNKKTERAQLDHVESNPTKAAQEKPDRHMSFFNGIIPSLQTFDDDEVVEFQLSVLQVLSDMKKRKKIVGKFKQLE